MKKIYLGSDHAGFELKQRIEKYFDQIGITYEDLGAFELDKDDDYPDFAVKVASKVQQTKAQGIIICGSSVGVCIVANKFKGVYAASGNNIKEAKISREHNDTNVLCLAGGQTLKKNNLGLSLSQAKKIIDVWLKTKPSDATRHVRRINKIKKIEKSNLK